MFSVLESEELCLSLGEKNDSICEQTVWTIWERLFLSWKIILKIVIYLGQCETPNEVVYATI